MNEAIHEVIGEVLSAIWRGLLYGLTFSAFWAVAVQALRLTPRILKAIGAW